MRGITISVEYDDLLALTLERNARHLDEIMVVTTPDDTRTLEIVARVPKARAFVTDAFHRRGEHFNKWAALEEGLDALGREGWLVVFDADIVFPPSLVWPALQPGRLYGPRRRLLKDPNAFSDALDWSTLPSDPDTRFVGYFQCFHGADPVLRKRPWFDQHWRYAARGDVTFQDRWSVELRTRLPFEVLHLGPLGQNWCGRVSQRTDGSVPSEAAARKRALLQLLRTPRKTPLKPLERLRRTAVRVARTRGGRRP